MNISELLGVCSQKCTELVFKICWKYVGVLTILNGTSKTRVDNYSRKIKGTPLQTASLEYIRRNLGTLHKKLIQHPLIFILLMLRITDFC